MRIDPSTDLGRTPGMYIVAGIIIGAISVAVVLIALTAISLWWPR